MELNEALQRISEIRGHIARTEVFRGYRAVPVAISGVLAVAASALQPIWVPDPATGFTAYFLLWVGVAAVSLLLFAGELALRYSRTASGLERHRLRLALVQFAPSIFAGGLVTAVILRVSPESRWMLPGLWAVLMGLGIFASLPLLPKAIVLVGAFYVAAGVLVLLLARGDQAFSPLAMGVPFGVGQLLAATVLYVTLERGDG